MIKRTMIVKIESKIRIKEMAQMQTRIILSDKLGWKYCKSYQEFKKKLKKKTPLKFTIDNLISSTFSWPYYFSALLSEKKN